MRAKDSTSRSRSSTLIANRKIPRWTSALGGSAAGARVAGLVFASLAVFSPAAQAHHSYAMFDQSKASSLQGTVAKVEWGNPHVFVWVYVQQPGGRYEPYSFESGSVSTLSRVGWSANTLRVGEKITVQYFPLRLGGRGGSLIRVIHADGRIDTADPNAPGGTTYSPSPGNGQ